jgi:Protein of unknown function (DUF1622)
MRRGERFPGRRRRRGRRGHPRRGGDRRSDHRRRGGGLGSHLRGLRAADQAGPLTLGRFLALGIEFQLASDILRTAVSPTLEDLAELGAIAAIRTVLNYFLAKEIERAEAMEKEGMLMGPGDMPKPRREQAGA